MSQGNASGGAPSEKPASPDIAGGVEATASAAYKTSSGLTIDFHSAEFNVTDDLNDCSGNYRTFQPLDGVVTADMRHQMERLSGRGAVESAVTETIPPKKSGKAADEPEPPDPAKSLTVISHGRTLIVDTDAGRAVACAKLLSDRGLTCTLLVTNPAAADSSFPRFDPCPFLEVDAVSITGAFGGFFATVSSKGNQRPLSECFGDGAAVFDLVLDLQSKPSYVVNGLPTGYYAPGTDPVILHEAMAELPEMRGRFHWPQFTLFQKNRCLHGRSQKHDCRRCIEVCPFGAIQSVDRAISIDHFRCQGCGGCAMVCPADAIHRVHPPRGEELSLLRHALEGRSTGALFPPTLVILDMDAVDGYKPLEMDEQDHGHRVYFEVEQIGHVGLDMLLAALAYGAGAVVVACGAQNTPGIREAAAWQVQMGRAILRGSGMPEDKIRFVVVPPENTRSEIVNHETAGLEGLIGKPAFPPASFNPAHDRRTLVRLAAQYLYDQSGVCQPSIPLPAGSPFGAVAVNSGACTLCMACVVACPSGALSAKGDAPRLEFIESRCHQCGLCEESCPERAIRLLPRILCDPEAVEVPAVLNETEPFRCVECGAPFATQRMIERMQDKLKGHRMYASERQMHRLSMCSTCRTRDALLSEEPSWTRR